MRSDRAPLHFQWGSKDSTERPWRLSHREQSKLRLFWRPQENVEHPSLLILKYLDLTIRLGLQVASFWTEVAGMTIAKVLPQGEEAVSRLRDDEDVLSHHRLPTSILVKDHGEFVTNVRRCCTARFESHGTNTWVKVLHISSGGIEMSCATRIDRSRMRA